MSLLMDALKKAEEAKRLAQAERMPVEEAAASLTLEPIEAQTHKTPPVAATPSPAPVTSSPAKAQQAAHNIFAAKQPVPAKSSIVPIIAGMTGLAVCVIAGYFWWQLQPRHIATAPAPVAALPPPALTPVTPLLPPVPPSVLPTAMPPVPEVSSKAEAPTAFSKRSEVQSEPPATGLRLSTHKPTVNPLAISAYDALQAGKNTQAEQLYKKLLAADSNSTDALYGLAALALQRGQLQQAEAYYQRVLEVDPRDPVALSALASLHERGLGEQTESRLKVLLTESTSPALHFALGNVYAREARWADAQQSYFLAWQGDNSNADTAFNLAVSLEHLRQPKLAIQYYQEALRLAKDRPAAFRTTDIEARLRELSP